MVVASINSLRDARSVNQVLGDSRGDIWPLHVSVNGGPTRFMPDFTAAPSLQFPTVTSPLPPPTSQTDSTTVPPVSKGAGGDGVRVRGGDGVGRECGVAEVALGEAERVAGGESGVGVDGRWLREWVSVG